MLVAQLAHPNKVYNHMLTQEEFKAGWAALVAKHGLKNNVYMQNIYGNWLRKLLL